MSDYADRVLKLVSDPEYKPLTLKAISRRFEVAPESYADFRAAVKALIKEGRLELAKDKRLSKPGTQRAL